MTFMRLLWVTLLVLLIGAGIALSMWGIPAPTATVERTIPHDRFNHS